ncbi:hypothetical protein K458DRAFT_431757 [Lentithecium fluviatile CBS 122367]|uniref:Uncharacterized protein n=1 Tax=Lentithecium fluviatile CBS 122367 TaxID=1168545 RepID=A0A6G1J1U5_9PLEO|nr:hypothetical protein K458DRAFT_431757 [Lentithecium fluviatile CBS 122367]
MSSWYAHDRSLVSESEKAKRMARPRSQVDSTARGRQSLSLAPHHATPSTRLYNAAVLSHRFLFKPEAPPLLHPHYRTSSPGLDGIDDHLDSAGSMQKASDQALEGALVGSGFGLTPHETKDVDAAYGAAPSTPVTLASPSQTAG